MALDLTVPPGTAALFLVVRAGKSWYVGALDADYERRAVAVLRSVPEAAREDAAEFLDTLVNRLVDVVEAGPAPMADVRGALLDLASLLAYLLDDPFFTVEMDQRGRLGSLNAVSVETAWQAALSHPAVKKIRCAS